MTSSVTRTLYRSAYFRSIQLNIFDTPSSERSSTHTSAVAGGLIIISTKKSTDRDTILPRKKPLRPWSLKRNAMKKFHYISSTVYPTISPITHPPSRLIKPSAKNNEYQTNPQRRGARPLRAVSIRPHSKVIYRLIHLAVRGRRCIADISPGAGLLFTP